MPNTLKTDVLLDPELIRELYPDTPAGRADAAIAAGNVAAIEQLRQKAISSPNDSSLDFMRPYADGPLTGELFERIMSCREMDYRNSSLVRKVNAGWKQTDSHRMLELSRNLKRRHLSKTV